MKRLVLIEDHDIVRFAVSTMVAGTKDLALVGERTNGEGAVEFVRAHAPDLVLVDIRMPKVDGLTVLAQLRKELPDVRVCILSTSDSESDIRTAVRLGAVGYILKTETPKAMIAAIRRLASGGTYFSPAVEAVLSRKTSYDELSAREREVLVLMGKGLSNQEIAASLGVTLETVKMHVKHVLHKLDVVGRVEAVSRAFELGIIKVGLALAIGWACATASAVEPLFDDAYTSDPAPLLVGDRLYLYTGHDADDADAFKNPDWRCYSTPDGTNWTSHGVVARRTDHPWAIEDSCWASQCVARNGKFYYYTSVRKRNGTMGIGVLVSDSPTGPFSDPLGRPLIDRHSCFGDYDPAVLFDGDAAYLYWGNDRLHCAKLNADMISIDPSFGEKGVRFLETPSDYQVGPWVWKHGDLYYLAYMSTGLPAGTGYATSRSPLGPWEPRGWLMKPDRSCGGVQPAVIDFCGKHLLFGWNRARYARLTPAPCPNRERRSVCMTEFDYEADGTIRTLPSWADCPEPFASRPLRSCR